MREAPVSALMDLLGWDLVEAKREVRFLLAKSTGSKVVRMPLSSEQFSDYGALGPQMGRLVLVLMESLGWDWVRAVHEARRLWQRV